MTHPEAKVSRVSSLLRANGTRITRIFLFLFRAHCSLRSSASLINLGVNYVFIQKNKILCASTVDLVECCTIDVTIAEQEVVRESHLDGADIAQTFVLLVR